MDVLVFVILKNLSSSPEGSIYRSAVPLTAGPLRPFLQKRLALDDRNHQGRELVVCAATVFTIGPPYIHRTLLNPAQGVS